MFGMLPDLTPRDPHSLWYTPLRGPGQLPNPPDQNHHGAQADAVAGAHHGNGGAPGAHQSRQRAMLVERTALSRLAADEAYLRHRKANVQNFGSGWLKPPGVSKTLHQMREEKRELEEHAEAMRREQLAQELAEAEAGGGDGDGDDGGGGGGMVDGDPESGMDDVQLDGAQDLDDDIPEAGDADFGYGDDDDEDDDDDDEEDEAEDSDEDGEITREERQNDLMAARMRLTDDAFREALVRGEPEGDDMYGGGEELEEEDRGHLLDEEDLGPDGEGGHGGGMGDMDADLDDDIPEAGDEDGGYEHTDSEAELSSSNSSSEEEEEEDEENSENNSEDVNDESRIVAEDDDSEEEDSTRQSLDIGFAPRAGALGPPGSPTGQLRGMMMRQHAPRHSMDLSGLLSNDESSFMDSSPIRRARR